MNTNKINTTHSDEDLAYAIEQLSQALVNQPNSEQSLKILEKYYTKGNAWFDINEPLPTLGTWTPLATTCFFDMPRQARFLLMNGANPDYSVDELAIPLHLAITRGNINVIQCLISFKADFNIKSKEGQTPLMRACDSGQSEVVKYLLETPGLLSADQIMVKDDKNKTCLDYALDNKNYNEIRLIEYYKLQRNIPTKSADAGNKKTKI